VAFGLSEEEKRRIEQEERVRIAEERYRADVRERIKKEPEPAKSGFSSRKLILVAILLVIVYVVIKSH
jgi:hypothetical protein